MEENEENIDQTRQANGKQNQRDHEIIVDFDEHDDLCDLCGVE